jgi:hypothetical protein
LKLVKEELETNWARSSVRRSFPVFLNYWRHLPTNLRPKSKLSSELYEIRREGKGWEGLGLFEKQRQEANIDLFTGTKRIFEEGSYRTGCDGNLTTRRRASWFRKNDRST